MTFKQWFKLNQATHDWDYERESCAEKAWLAAKQEALKIVDKYQYIPAYPYLKETMEREL